MYLFGTVSFQGWWTARAVGLNNNLAQGGLLLSATLLLSDLSSSRCIYGLSLKDIVDVEEAVSFSNNPNEWKTILPCK